MTYSEFIKARMAVGETPNDITRRIEETLASDATDWALYGDGHWREDTCCSVCGSSTAGLCPDGCRADPTRTIILRSEFNARKAVSA